MIRADQMPPEVVEAAAVEMAPRPWSFYTDAAKEHFRKKAHAAIAAALSAWPNVTTTSWFENGTRKAVLNIPLPQEVSDGF